MKLHDLLFSILSISVQCLRQQQIYHCKLHCQQVHTQIAFLEYLTCLDIVFVKYFVQVYFRILCRHKKKNPMFYQLSLFYTEICCKREKVDGLSPFVVVNFIM